MSDSTSGSREMRTSYTEFMNAFHNLRKASKLEDGFFQGKYFFDVLNVFLEKFIESEKKTFKRFENVVSAVDESGSTVSRQLAGFLHNLLDSNQINIDMQYRFIAFIVYQKFDSLKVNLELVFQDILKNHSDDIVFEKIWEVVEIYSLVSKITENGKWFDLIPFTPSACGESLVFDVFGKMTLFEFFYKYFQHVRSQNVHIFPHAYNALYGFFCPASKWKEIKGGFTNIDTKDSGIEPNEYDQVHFKHPFLVRIYDGKIAGPRTPDDIPFIRNFYKKP